MKRLLDDDDYEYTKTWFNHLYAWNRLLDSAGYVDHKFMGTEEKRVRTYAALLMLADDNWATAAEIEAAAELGDGDIDSVLEGLSYLREVDIDVSDDGDLICKLTKFGRAWASALVAECDLD